MKPEVVPPETRLAIIRQYQRELASRAGRAVPKLTRRLNALRTAAGTWRLRGLRYGPSGRRPVDVRLRSRLAGNPQCAWKTHETSS